MDIFNQNWERFRAEELPLWSYAKMYGNKLISAYTYSSLSLGHVFLPKIRNCYKIALAAVQTLKA